MATLFTIQTPRLRLTWSGPPPPEVAVGGLAVRAAEAEGLRLDGEAPATDAEADVWVQEETAYPVLLQSLTDAPVALRHRDPVLTAGLVADDGGRVVHGHVRFGSQAGRSRLVVWSGDRPELELDLLVRPSKLSIKDVEAMRREVEAAAAGLSLAALRPTTAAGGGSPEPPAPVVWLAALRQSAEALAAALGEVDRRPVTETARPLAMVRASDVRRPSAETRRHVQRYGQTERLPARPALLTADTPAHRWLARRLDAVIARLSRLATEESTRRPSARRRVVLAEMEETARRLRRLRSLPVLAEAAALRAPAVPPLVLRRRSAYAAAFDALRRLDQGLDLQAGGLDVATQDLAALYETWAALAVAATLADVLSVEPPPQPFGIAVRGTDVRLRRGRHGTVRLATPERRVELVYNPRYPAPPALLVQRPDLVLTVWEGREVLRRVVLDAKYRRDDSATYRRRHGAAGPPEDALGTLHRYRDAIVGPDRQSRVDGAVALFPGGDDVAFRASRLWTSIDALGIGAVPLRPGQTAALCDLLRRLVSA